MDFTIRRIKEGRAEIYVSTEEKVSKHLPVFYNPVMKFNRDITILLLKQFSPMSLCDPLAGTGIRAIRFAKELSYKSIVANDINKRAVTLIRKNMRLNKVKFEVKNEDANIMLLNSKGFDFIDLDVFGSPNFVLDSAIKRLARNGILGVTATDTAPLSGTYPKTCLRKYWALPLRNELKHEIGLRILIRKVQLIGSQYGKALIPVFSYSKEHYFRAFFRCRKSKKEVDKALAKHHNFTEAGPIWNGNLWDIKLVRRMYKSAKDWGDNDLTKFLWVIKEEAIVNTVGFYDIPQIVKQCKLKEIPRKELIINSIRNRGHKAAYTHFNGNGIRSDIIKKELLSVLESIYLKSNRKL